VQEHVLLEAVLLVVGRRLEHDPHALADLVGNGTAVALQRARALDLALVMQVAALGGRAHDEGRSSTAQGGKARPSGAGVSPVALATAVLSMAGLEPSRKELNILG